SGRLFLANLDERFRRNAKAAVETPNHSQSQRTLAVEDFINAIAASDKRYEVAWLKAFLFHVIFDRLDRIGEVDSIVLGLPCLDKRDQEVQPVAFGGATPRIHEWFDLLERAQVIAFGLDRFDVHGSVP